MTRRAGRRVAIAYYSMEVALEDALPTFSGGLGVLAGDHLRAAADRGLPIAGVTLLYRHGFFRQSLEAGEQHEAAVEWSPAARLERLGVQVGVQLAGRTVAIGVWRRVLTGVDGHAVPVYLLDTDVGTNAPADRLITDRLYTGDPGVRLLQESVLGIGGPAVLDALGHRRVAVHHLNEGHGALVGVALLARRLAPEDPSAAVRDGLPGVGPQDLDAVRPRCVFTTHTPVPAGHDRFDPPTAAGVLGRPLLATLESLGCLEPDGTLNMTLLGMRCAATVNAVSLRHRDVTRGMFVDQPVDSVTNGVHTATWAAPATAAVFDRYLPGWRRDSAQLRYATGMPLDEVRDAHAANKAVLCREVRRRTGVVFRENALTVGVARRFAAYKRNDLVVSDPARLRAIASVGPVQIVFAGKAHPRDGDAKELVRRVAAAAAGARRGSGGVTVAFFEDYGMDLGRLLCSGSDVWLNTPAPPNEASGTSGMKAALNGVPSLSTLDGWWLEGLVEGVTGWAIADGSDAAERLYSALEETVLPAYYKEPERLAAMGRSAIALNGSFFSAHRMVDEYARRAYRVPLSRPVGTPSTG